MIVHTNFAKALYPEVKKEWDKHYDKWVICPKCNKVCKKYGFKKRHLNKCEGDANER